MTGWNNDTVDRLNYSLMNINDRLGEIRDNLVERNNIEQDNKIMLEGIHEFLFEISKSLREKKNEL